MNIGLKNKKDGKPIVKKFNKPTHFFLRIFSRHPSSRDLRDTILVPGKRAVYRHGSTSDVGFEYEINSAECVKNSKDKLKMKQCFDKGEVKHAKWIPLVQVDKDNKQWLEFLKSIKFGSENSWLIIKSREGSRGIGNYIVKSQGELDAFLKSKRGLYNNYIAEVYKHFSVEYRLHVSEGGCFYTNRKMLKNGTPKEERFQRHDDNCKWILESNPLFNKPENWGEIVNDCIKALKAIGGDVLAFDVKCTSIKDEKDKKCDWVILESCSAPSFGEKTMENYKKELPKILKSKYNVDAKLKQS